MPTGCQKFVLNLTKKNFLFQFLAYVEELTKNIKIGCSFSLTTFWSEKSGITLNPEIEKKVRLNLNSNACRRSFIISNLGAALNPVLNHCLFQCAGLWGLDTNK